MGNRLRDLRLDKGKTLKELVDDLKVKTGLAISSDTLAKYEQGNREPKFERWQKLADYFGVPIPYLQGIGVSKNEVLRDCINELSSNSTGKIALLIKDILKEYNTYFSLNLNEFTSNTSEYSKYTDYVERAIEIKDDMFLEYSMQKFIPMITNYSFLSNLNKSDKIRYYTDLEMELELQLTRGLNSWEWVTYKVNRMSLDDDSKEALVDVLGTLFSKIEDLQTEIDYLKDPSIDDYYDD